MPISTQEQAINILEHTRADFLNECRTIAYLIARGRHNRSVTIDDVREQIKLPPGMDGRVFGAVFNSKEWEAVGFVKSRQSINHHRPITVFQLKQPKVSHQESLI